MNSSPPILELQDVSVTLQGAHKKKLHVLSGLSFSLQTGQLAVILGDIGSGKTTLLNVIAGFIRPSNGMIGTYSQRTTKFQGKVFIDGEDVSLTEPHYRDVGLVMQRFTLYPHMSVKKNLAFPLTMKGIPNQEKKIASIINKLEMKEYANYKTEDLSGGQAQTVALGKLMLRDPKVALFDEAFSHLDPVLRKKLRETVIDGILSTGEGKKRCVVFVSHEVVDARKANLIIVLKTKENLEKLEVRTTHHIFQGDNPGEAWEQMQKSMQTEIIELVATTED